MSYQIKITERKNDGWFYEDSLQSLDTMGIYESDLKLWNNALLCLFSNSDLAKEWDNAKTIKDKKKVLWLSIKNELKSLEDDLKIDLERSIHIYPLIKKGV